MSFTQQMDHVREQFFPLVVPKLEVEFVACADVARFKSEVGKIYDSVFPKSERSFTAPLERRDAAQGLRGRYAEIHQEHMLLQDFTGSVGGWMSGEMEDPETFYIRTIGVVPERRNARFQAHFYPHFLEYLRALGYERVTSEHHPNNRTVIILQLHAGFNIAGFSIDERWGPQVKMVRYLHDDRELEFQRRFRLPEYDRKR
jgi:hypothetical protein